MIGKLDMSGDVTFKVIRPLIKKAPLSWRIQNAMRWAFIKGWIVAFIITPLVVKFRLPVMLMMGELAVKIHKGDTDEWIDYGVVSRQLITDAGVTALRDQWNVGAFSYQTFNFHGIGTGAVAENVTDTALGAESTTALNPDSTRATGTRSTPASNQWRSIGTLTCDSNIAVTEHGILSQAATGGGTLWDRSVFAVINLVGANPDSIQCTYTCTLSAGG